MAQGKRQSTSTSSGHRHGNSPADDADYTEQKARFVAKSQTTCCCKMSRCEVCHQIGHQKAACPNKAKEAESRQEALDAQSSGRHHIVTFEVAGGVTLGHKHGFLLSVLGITGRTVAMVLTGEDGQIRGKGRGRPFSDPGEAIAPLPSAAILNTVVKGIMTKAFLFTNMLKIYGRCIS